jgi:acyl carrier protein
VAELTEIAVTKEVKVALDYSVRFPCTTRNKCLIFLQQFATLLAMEAVSKADQLPAPEPAVSRALELMREALENQKLCDPSLDVDEILVFAQDHPDRSVVDSFASVEILSSLDGVFGTVLPKEILNHKSLTTLDGLTKSIQVLEARLPETRAAGASREKGEK